MKFGVTMLPDNLETLASRARLAEDAGFDYIGIGDSQSLFRELYVSLSVVAMSTQRAMLGPTVSNPQTRHPAVTAAAIASINELSKGRAFLGLGSGDSAVLNLGLRPARLTELRHYIQTVRNLLAGESGEYHGARAHVRWANAGRPTDELPSADLATAGLPNAGLPVAGLPTTGISNAGLPIAISAEGPRTLALAGAAADAAIVHTGLTPDAMADTIARIREGERSAGRQPGATEVWAFAKCNIADRRDDAINEIKMALAASAHHAFRHTLDGKNVPPHLREPITILQQEYRPAEHEQTGPTRNAALTDELGLTDYLTTRFAIAGAPDECRQKARQIFAAGANTLLITAIGPSPDAIISRFGQEVIAPLRGE